MPSEEFSMRTLKRAVAGAAVVMAPVLPAPVAIAAPADVYRAGAATGYISDCTGELVSLEGTYQAVIQTQTDGSWAGHVTIRGKGIGDQGNVYEIHENALDRVSADGSETGQDEFRMTSKGSAPNFIVSVKYSISAAGDFDFSFRSICPG